MVDNGNSASSFDASDNDLFLSAFEDYSNKTEGCEQIKQYLPHFLL